MRTYVTFRNVTTRRAKPRAELPPPLRQGGALANELLAQLRASGYRTDPAAGRDELGWYFYFEVPSGKHCLVLRYRVFGDASAPDWYAWLERERGVALTLLGFRRRGISPLATEAVHEALRALPLYTDVQWHRRSGFRIGTALNGTSNPAAP